MILRTSLFLFAALALAAQSRTADVSGVWSRAGGGGGNRNPVTQWSAEKLSFTLEGAKLWNANKPGKGPRQVPPAFGNDPMGDANPPGLYRTLVYNRSFEMIQLPGRVVQMFEWAKVWRTIWTDGRPVPEDIAEGPFCLSIAGASSAHEHMGAPAISLPKLFVSRLCMTVSWKSAFPQRVIGSTEFLCPKCISMAVDTTF